MELTTKHGTPAQAATPPAAGNGAVRARHSHIFEPETHSHYVEPHWVSSRLFAVEDFGAPRAQILDPCAGWGRVLQGARAAGYGVIGADIVDRRSDPDAFADFPFVVCDFLQRSPVRSAWSVVCNPPFDHVREFCERALDIAIHKVAVLMPLCRIVAAHWLENLPLETVWVLTPRPSMPPASYIAAGKRPGGGRPDYCWLIFAKQSPTGAQPKLRRLHRDGRPDESSKSNSRMRATEFPALEAGIADRTYSGQVPTR